MKSVRNIRRGNLYLHNHKRFKMDKKEFFDQIEEDIQILKADNLSSDPRLEDINYAFNYWVLDKMYNLDDESIFDKVLEGDDKGIDCFVHYEDAKQLFLIQNKFYDENTSLAPKEVSHFLNTSLSVLREGTYNKSKPLQELFTKVKNDPEYKIYFHLYITNQTNNETVETLFSQFNVNNKTVSDRASIEAKIFKLNSIVEAYYGKQFDNKIRFNGLLTANNNRMLLKILPQYIEYRLPKNFLEAYYVMTPIKDLYEMYRKANEKKYPLFDENIREYLGKTPINEGIKRTLDSDDEERINFFFYNNGVTIICDEVIQMKRQGASAPLSLTMPKIVNGCQTVSTIYEVLTNYAKRDPNLNRFQDVYVMSKILIKNIEVQQKKPDIYLDIVKYTNKQNNLTEKAFNSNRDLFANIQKSFKDRGFLLLVRGGSLITFKKEYEDKKLKNELLFKAKTRAEKLGVAINKFSDITIQLEKLLQVFVAFRLDGNYAYNKKPELLDKTSELYDKYVLKIPEYLTMDLLLNLWIIYRRVEIERRSNSDKLNKLPIPFYVLSFLGSFIENKEESSNIKRFANSFFSQSESDISKQFEFLCDLTSAYTVSFSQEKKLDYNDMIKLPIAYDILNKQITNLNTQRSYKNIQIQLTQLNN